MKCDLTKVAKILMYNGPSAKEVIADAIKNNYEVDVVENESYLEVIVKSIIVYDVSITDVYTYNADNQLVKHLLKINGTEKVIFDKFNEALSMISDIKKLRAIAS